MKKSVKLITLLLIIVMSISLFAACGTQNAQQSNTGEATNNSQAAGTSGSSDKADNASQVDKTPVTLHLFLAQTSTQSPELMKDDVANFIREKTGISIMWQVGNADTELTAKLAAGDLPDMVMIQDAKFIDALIKANAIIDMAQYVNDSTPNLKNDPRFEFCKKYLSNDTGKFFFMPTMAGPSEIAGEMDYNYVVRWDLYSKLGYPAINDLPDLIPVFKEMLALEPQNASGKKNYALGFNFDWGYYWPFICHLGTMFGYSQDSFPGLVQIDPATKEVTSLITNPDSLLWKGMDFYNEAYRQGILDPESFTQNWDQFTQKIADLRYLALDWVWEGRAYAEPTIKQLGLEKEIGFATLPPLSSTKQVLMGYGDQPFGDQRMWCVTTNCKYPERAVQLLDFCNDEDNLMVIYNGLQGKIWDVIDGKAQIKSEYKEATRSPSPEMQAETGYSRYTFTLTLKNLGYVNKKYNSTLNISSDPSNLPEQFDPAVKPFAADSVNRYGAKSAYELLSKLNIKVVPDDRTVQKFLPLTPDDISLIFGKIDNYLKTNVFKAVMTKDPEEYARYKKKIVDDCMELGLEKYNEYYAEAYKNAYKLYGEYTK